ncbi:dienelactone hydrolase family protein [Leptospira kanakyensis]|uniref:dienelactone hydrolase family protein n=1 Tax=Leptospira kanakyensis TaxID=2484968 RepID=UPI00223CF16D|nr:dienelactone hydrolase family protein [Leptospira kanakyensis]MCW7479751.1 dienelactone hydrolase family protein [Leptospira kanakyensis]
MKQLISIFALVFAIQCASVPTAQLPIKSSISGNPVEYKLDGKTYEGFLAVDSSVTGKRPGVLVIHEWWGVNEYPKQRAKQLADLGYVAFVMDVYGKGILAKDHVEAGKLSGANGEPKVMLKKIYKALEILKSNPNVDTSKIGAIGYCFGGGGVIELALDGADLKGGVVSFHGFLSSKNLASGAKKIKSKVLVHHGADDPFIPKTSVETFIKTVTDAKAPVTFISHPGAVHGFTRPGAEARGLPGLAYNEKADYASFGSMKDFFATNFK